MTQGKDEKLVVKEIMIELKELITKSPVSIIVCFEVSGKIRVMSVGLNGKLQKIANLLADDVLVFCKESMIKMDLPEGIVGQT